MAYSYKRCAMTQEEQKDLEALKARVNERKIQAFDYLSILIDLNPGELKNHGYKTVGDALQGVMRMAIRDITQLVKEHVRKYPDERR